MVFSKRDEAELRQLWDLMHDSTDEYLDVLLVLLTGQRFLQQCFTDKDIATDGFIDKVRPDFGDWLRDTCLRPNEVEWILKIYLTIPANDRQPGALGLYYIRAFVYPVTTAVKPVLHDRVPASEAKVIQEAWLKSILRQAAMINEIHLSWAYRSLENTT